MITNLPLVVTDASPRLDHSGSTSVPEELSEEDPPTVTPTPAYGSPEGLGGPSGPRSHLSTEALPRASFREDQETRPESDIQEELEAELSSTSEHQRSERLLRLEKEAESQEKLSTSKHVSSSTSEDGGYSAVSRERKPEEGSTKSLNAAADVQTSPHGGSSSSASERSSSPASSLRNAAQDVEVASSPSAHGYNDDFESSAYSPRDEQHGSKPDSRKDSPSRASPSSSPDDEVEEEISEELSQRSGTSEASRQSGRLLELHSKADDGKLSVTSTPVPPAIDEMSTFTVGDRVLVGGVQPGTLRFKGTTSFANGFWAGVELDKSEGSNNGTYDGVVYFQCLESHGIFAPPDKISHLPDKFEMDAETTEDEDSFFDDLADKDQEKGKQGEDKSHSDRSLESRDEETHKFSGSGDRKASDESVHKAASHINSQRLNSSKRPIANGNLRNITLEFEDAPTTLLISDLDTMVQGKQSQKEITVLDQSQDVDSLDPPEGLPTEIQDEKVGRKDSVDALTDTLLNSFLRDTVKQFTEIKKVKEQKIQADNQLNGHVEEENIEEEWMSSVDQKDGLPFFLPTEKEELSSPELCNRPVRETDRMIHHQLLSV